MFSAIGLDHGHEQNNGVVKGDGGAIGLLTDPAASVSYTHLDVYKRQTHF